MPSDVPHFPTHVGPGYATKRFWRIPIHHCHLKLYYKLVDLSMERYHSWHREANPAHGLEVKLRDVWLNWFQTR